MDSASYQGSGNTCYDLSGQNAHAEALYLPSFDLNSAQIKNFNFDGSNDGTFADIKKGYSLRNLNNVKWVRKSSFNSEKI